MVALLLIVKASFSLNLRTSNGLNINSTEFSSLKVSRGQHVIAIWNFFVTSNAVILHEIEVQIMKEALPENARSPNGVGCFEDSSYLTDEATLAFLKTNTENVSLELEERLP